MTLAMSWDHPVWLCAQTMCACNDLFNKYLASPSGSPVFWLLCIAMQVRMSFDVMLLTFRTVAALLYLDQTHVGCLVLLEVLASAFAINCGDCLVIFCLATIYEMLWLVLAHPSHPVDDLIDVLTVYLVMHHPIFYLL